MTSSEKLTFPGVSIIFKMYDCSLCEKKEREKEREKKREKERKNERETFSFKF